MSVPHHGDSERQRDLTARFIEQVTGTGGRQYPGGRMGADDDGDLTYAIAADKRHKTVVIRFAKPVEWIGLDAESAQQLIDALHAKLFELRGITV